MQGQVDLAMAAVEATSPQLTYQLIQCFIGQIILEGMGENWYPMMNTGELYRLLRGDLVSWDKISAAVADIMIKGLLGIADDAMISQEAGKMHPRDHSSGESCLKRLHADRDTVVRHKLAHPGISDGPGISKLRDPGKKLRILIAQIQTDDMDIFSAPGCTVFNAGNHLKIITCSELEILSRGYGLIDAGDGIVIS